MLSIVLQTDHFIWQTCEDCDGSDMSDAERDYWGERL